MSKRGFKSAVLSVSTHESGPRGTLLVFTMEEHALVMVVVVLVCDLLLPVGVTFPQLLVYDFLDLWAA